MKKPSDTHPCTDKCNHMKETSFESHANALHRLTIPLSEPAPLALSITSRQHRRVRCGGVVKCQTATHERCPVKANRKSTGQAIAANTQETFAGTCFSQTLTPKMKPDTTTAAATVRATAPAESQKCLAYLMHKAANPK